MRRRGRRNRIKKLACEVGQASVASGLFLEALDGIHEVTDGLEAFGLADLDAACVGQALDGVCLDGAGERVGVGRGQGAQVVCGWLARTWSGEGERSGKGCGRLSSKG